MPDENSNKPPSPPWQRDPEGTPPEKEPVSKARTIHGLAAELKNEIRADRMRQADRRKNPL
jgi:hypothetical protein